MPPLAPLLSALLAAVVASAVPTTATPFPGFPAPCTSCPPIPIVFVHGVLGFGPTEMLGASYWGWTGAGLVSDLISNGVDYIAAYKHVFPNSPVLYATVGPVASNWDRACELYAQIMGTQTDYGVAHSSKYGHARYGQGSWKDFRGNGFYPQWSPSNPVIFVVHSMGGTTVRVLEQLLNNGNATERAATTDGSLSPLFAGNFGAGMIHSIHAISSPFDGSQLYTQLSYANLVGTIQNLLETVAGDIGFMGNNGIYDFKLDQWGLQAQPSQSLSAYVNSVFSSSIWTSNAQKDLAGWDLSTPALANFNTWSKQSYASTYYFSYSTYTTSTCLTQPCTNWLWGFICTQWGSAQCALPTTEVYLQPTANTMGNLWTGSGFFNWGGGSYDWSWAQNDGLVAARSSATPQVGLAQFSAPQAYPGSGTLSKGVWYNRQYQRDHMAIIGLRTNTLDQIIGYDSSAGVFVDISNTIIRTLTSSGRRELAEEAAARAALRGNAVEAAAA